MTIYLQITNGGNNLIFTDKKTAKIFDCVSSGKYAGIDLYNSQASKKLSEYFNNLKRSNDLNEYSDIYSSFVINYTELLPCFDNSEMILVFSE